MRTLLTICLLVWAEAQGATAYQANRRGAWRTTGSSYILRENFETPTTGYENSWDVGPATVTPNFSTAGLSLEGSQCLRLVAATARPGITNTFTAALDTVEAYWLYRMDSIPTAASGRPFLSLFDASRNIVGSVFIYASDRKIYLYNGTISSGKTTTAMNTGTTYHCWFRFQTNALSFGFSTDGVRPTEGNSFVSLSTNIPVASVKFLKPGISLSDTEATLYYDKIRVSASTIGSNPD